jgi:hypothetical protein
LPDFADISTPWIPAGAGKQTLPEEKPQAQGRGRLRDRESRIFVASGRDAAPRQLKQVAPEGISAVKAAVQAIRGNDVIMIRFLLRFFGLWILAAGFIFLIYDGAKSIADQTMFITRVNDVWFAIHQDSLRLLQPMLEQSAAAWLWDPTLKTLVEQPAWLILGILGALLIVIGRKKKPLIGYSRN